jgi:hypothetical protein
MISILLPKSSSVSTAAESNTTQMPINGDNLLGASRKQSLDLLPKSGASSVEVKLKTVAQLFRVPVPRMMWPITGPASRPMRTDAISIGSYGDLYLEEGGGAGINNRYFFGPTERFIRNVRYVNNFSTRSWAGVLNEIKRQVKMNGGAPVSEILISTHGRPGAMIFGDKNDFSVSKIASDLINKKLLARGGQLILLGCSIAAGKNAQNELKNAAKKFSIYIQASETNTNPYVFQFSHRLFTPDGKMQ